MNLADAVSPPAKQATNATALTPAQRREVEIWFAQALDFSSERRREYAAADGLFRKCLAFDGSNVLVVTAYLENLARWRGRKVKSTWRGWWARRAFNKKQFRGAQFGGVQTDGVQTDGVQVGGVQFDSVQARHSAALALLSREPEPGGLRILARIAKAQLWEMTEEAYLREILLRDGAADDAHARLAEICVAKADFRCAEAHVKVSFTEPGAWEAFDCLQAVREPIPEGNLSEEAQASGNAPQVSEELVAAKQFTVADRLLRHTADASGHSLGLREARENLQLAQLQFQFDALAKLEHDGNTLAARARVSLHQKLARLRLDIAGMRADRFPEDWERRLSLAEQLIRVGNYFEALRRLKEPPRAPQGVLNARALRLTAETQQRLKRFDAAMDVYRELLANEDFESLPMEEQSKVQVQARRLEEAIKAAT